MSLKKLTLFALLLTFSLVLGACSDDGIVSKEEYKIYGTVTAEDINGVQKPISGVTISISGDTNGTVSTAAGKWSAVVKGDVTVDASKYGYRFDGDPLTASEAVNNLDFEGRLYIPVANPTAGGYFTDQDVTLAYKADYTIYYTVVESVVADDDTPDDADADELIATGTVYAGGTISVALGETLKAVAVKDDDDTVVTDVLVAKYTKATPVAKYTFDDETATDSSENEYDGTLEGGVSIVDGVRGKAVELDGNDGFVDLPDGILNGIGDFTIATWINANELNNWSRIFDFGYPEASSLFMAANEPSTYVDLSGSIVDAIGAPYIVDNGQWQHVALTRSGTSLVLYINGQERARDDNATDKVFGNTTGNYIGKSNFATDKNLRAQFDEFVIYDAALSAAGIEMLYNGATQ